MTCTWCHEREADGGNGPDGLGWCVRCRDAEEAVQAAKRAELEAGNGC